MKNPVSIKCPVAGKFKFQQHGDILFETRIRGGVTQMPRPNVYCKENISGKLYRYFVPRLWFPLELQHSSKTRLYVFWGISNKKAI